MDRLTGCAPSNRQEARRLRPRSSRIGRAVCVPSASLGFRAQVVVKVRAGLSGMRVAQLGPIFVSKGPLVLRNAIRCSGFSLAQNAEETKLLQSVVKPGMNVGERFFQRFLR